MNNRDNYSNYIEYDDPQPFNKQFNTDVREYEERIKQRIKESDFNLFRKAIKTRWGAYAFNDRLFYEDFLRSNKCMDEFIDELYFDDMDSPFHWREI